MKILIAGASGFIGQELVKALETNHSITVLGRNKTTLQQHFTNRAAICTWDTLPEQEAQTYDVLINLCGHNIATSRWTNEVKKQLIESRVQTSTALINWAIQQHAKPRLYCANAIGIYGLQENGSPDAFDESSSINFDQPKDFLSEIGIRWQQALQPAVDYGMQITITRFGVVLKKGQGILKKMTPSFYFGLGSIIGDGRQIISWVHIKDVVEAFLFLLNNPELAGAFNITSPYPISQEEFARALAKAIHRPLLLKTPVFLIRTLFGEMGECLLLRGQRVIPKRLLENGYQFYFPQLSAALNQEFQS